MTNQRQTLNFSNLKTGIWFQNSQGLDELQNICVMVPSRNTETTRLTGYFCPHTVYNLSKRVLTNAEMKVLVKGVDSAPIQHQINKPELKTDFKKFCRRMQLK